MKEQLLTLTPSHSDWGEGVWSTDGTVGYFGEASGEELISGVQLSSLVNLTAGGAHNSDAGWLKIQTTDSFLYIAKKTFRYNLAPSSLGDRNLINGSRIVEVKGKSYSIRTLLKNTNLSTGGAYTSDPPSSYGSEWNQIMYRLVNREGLSGEGIPFGEIAQYSDLDLGVSQSTGEPGSRTIIAGAASGLFRGGGDVTGHSFGSLSGAVSVRGWRPVLELL